MKILVCGSRTWCDTKRLEDELDAIVPKLEKTTVIHGGAQGADNLAGAWAAQRLYDIRVFPADWHRYGRMAGFIRNQAMLSEGDPDLVVAFWDGKSAGTKGMIELARRAKVPVKVILGKLR